MMRWSLRIWSFGVWLACLLLCSTTASAQSAFSGVVKDTSGAVLPGVTIEASSPVLIEKVRTAVSDGQGRYTITELRPGTYTLVFTLAGFNVFKRDACFQTALPESRRPARRALWWPRRWGQWPACCWTSGWAS